MIQHSISNRPMPWFALFNFVIYLSVFLGRILRDSILFSQEYGDILLPLVFIINAVLITWVADKMVVWEATLKRKRFFLRVYLFSALFFFAIGALLNPFVVENIFPSPLYKTIVAFVFYFVSEVPIFLCVNIIWIIAVDYFTKQEEQKDFPKISAVGLLGIAVASAIVLINSFAKVDLSFYIMLWGVVCLVLLGIALHIDRNCKKIPNIYDDGEDENEETEPGLFWENAKKDLKWIRNYPFLWLFTLVTVCNFLLLAIFDQTLANGAAHLGINAKDLSFILALFTLGFGLLAAGFQWFIFPKLFNRLGVARLNLYAPMFMLFGASSYLLFASDFFEPVWKLFNFEPERYLLHFVILARMAGWGAEFLFNQSMLPFVYGALPSQDENRGRLFVEGPVTAVTNGLSGMFLLVYFFAFSQQSEGYGIKLDLLFVIAMFAAAFMALWSKGMIREFKVVLKKKASEGEISNQKLLTFLPDLTDDIGLIEEEIACRKSDEKDLYKNFRLLVLAKGNAAAPILESLVLDPNVRSNNKAAAIRELAALKAVDSIKAILRFYSAKQFLPGADEIEAISLSGQKLGFNSEIKTLFKKWLDTFDPDYFQAKNLLKSLANFGLDGALIVGEFIESFQNREKHGSNLSQNDYYLLAAEMGSERFYPLLAEISRKDELSDWSSISNIDFFDNKHAIDAFSLLLPHLEDIDDGAAASLIKIFDSHEWLFWPTIWLIEMDEGLPGNLSTVRHILPEVIASVVNKKERHGLAVDFSYSSFSSFENVKQYISFDTARELEGIEWSECTLEAIKTIFEKREQSSEGIDFLKYIVYILEHPEAYSEDVGFYLSCTKALSGISKNGINGAAIKIAKNFILSEFRKQSVYYYLMKSWNNSASDWFRRRRKQWLDAYLMLVRCIDPEIWDSIPANSAQSLLFEDNRHQSEIDRIRRDKILTMIEQSGIERETFSVLRSDLLNMKFIAGDKDAREKYLGKRVKNCVTREDADLIWKNYIEDCNDILLKTSMLG